MNISGIRPGQGFYSYNAVKINQLRNQQIAAAKQIQNEQQKDAASVDTEDARKSQTFSSYDYAKTYRKDMEYELVGRDSDINSLDEIKPVAETDVEKIIRTYRNFSKENVNTNPRKLEDFGL